MSPDPPPGTVALRVCSSISADARAHSTAREMLEELYGEIALESVPFGFDLSDYYRAEMGEGLVRRWLCFARPMDPSLIVEFKLAVRAIEGRLCTGEGSRKVNLDPGYLDLGKLVLASGKYAPDKVYLGEGVWAHTCLRYADGRLSAPDHSFPDFRDGRFDAFFVRARSLLKQYLRSERAEVRRDRPKPGPREPGASPHPTGTRS
ncbi:DUF4416 family protein [Candidatus Fermentibacterales bacterium]|nr:DUF4416 family protein [Candidatus Fermentibacterales bacterium]